MEHAINQNFSKGIKIYMDEIENNPETIDRIVSLTKYVNECKKNKHSIEALIIAFQIAGDIFVPMLIDFILYNLELNTCKSKYREQNEYNKNLSLLALTHDIKLYNLLEKLRKTRNIIAHDISSGKDIEKAKRKAEEGLELYKTISLEIRDRLNGKIPIPSLKLYLDGWNDSIRHITDNWDNIIREVDNGL